MHRADVKLREGTTYLLVDGRPVCGLGWRSALVLAKLMKDCAAGAEYAGDSTTLGGTAFALRREGADCLLLVAGALRLRCPWTAMAGLAQAIRNCGRRAEEQDQVVAEQLAEDQGILVRAGARFGITSDPKVQAEALKVARHGSDRTPIHRYLKDKYRGRQYGAPVVTVGTPPRQRNP